MLLCGSYMANVEFFAMVLHGCDSMAHARHEDSVSHDNDLCSSFASEEPQANGILMEIFSLSTLQCPNKVDAQPHSKTDAAGHNRVRSISVKETDVGPTGRVNARV